MQLTSCAALLVLALCVASIDAKAKGKTKQKGPGYDAVVGKVAKNINKASERSRELQNEHMKNVNKDPGTLITKEAMQNMMKGNSFLPQKAGTKSITVQSGQGFNGITNYQPAGWKITESMSGPTEKKQESSNEKEPVYSYPMGLGPVLLNQCTARNYSKSSPCYNSKLFDLQNSICLNLMDAAGYIGVGFDGRGFYSSDSRKTSLVQRVCANKATFIGQDIPDTMNVFGIFHTVAETKSFQSVDQYMRYIRHKAGLSNQKGLFTSEASKYSKASSFGANLGGIGSMIGAGIGAAVGGPGGAMIGAAAGGAIGGSIEGGSGSGSGNSKSKGEASASSTVKQTDTTNQAQGSTQNFFAIMYVNVILYELTLDEVKPSDLSLTVLKDYMDLPVSYYSVGADVKYQNFLLRWGTHFIRSGKFGGQLKVTKTMKTKKSMTSQEFASIAETEFKSMFATLQSSYTQKSSSWGFLGIGGKKRSTSQNANAKTETDYKSTAKAQNKMAQNFFQSEFTQTSVEAQGGTPQIAEAIVDFYTPAFKQLFHDWLVSIKDYAKPFEFQLKAIHDLFNMRMKDLFPSGNIDFGCVGGGKGKLKIRMEAKTNKRFYIDTKVKFIGNKTVEEKVKVYCRYSSIDAFQKDMERKRISLERSVATYMVEGPFPTSSFEMPAGEIGCEEKTLSQLQVSMKAASIMKYSELKSAPFLLTLDLPQSVEGIATRMAKFKILFRGGRWFAIDPKATVMHLYDGCQVGVSKDMNICFRNLILTYEETSGFFHIKPANFKLSKHRMPTLPNWLSGSTVGRAKRLQTVGDVTRNVASKQVSVPCNVKWLNSHRLDPRKKENCIHFTAATEGDIFVIFASIPKKHHTWYYLQINPDGVAFYKGFTLETRTVSDGMGVLGDKNLFQSFFVCVIQEKGSVLMQYGKADPDSETGTVYSSYRFTGQSKFSRLSFYSFGSGEKPVSLMDIRLTKQMPTNVVCLDDNQIKVNGHCVLACHAECNGCKRARDNKECKQCKNVRVVHGSGSMQVTECLAKCPVGKHLSMTQEKLCVACPAGLFKNVIGNQKCTACPAGTFSSGGATKCSPCAAGSFNDKEGQQQCRKCAAGTFSGKEGAIKCDSCSKGKFSSAGKSLCEPCPFGHYGDRTGLSACRPCRRGFYASSRGQQSCRRCGRGSTSAAGSRSCSNSCTKGEFSPKKGVACSKCAPGSFTESAGSSACSQCQPGSYQPRSGQSGCVPAPKGSYVSGRGSTAFQKCPVGTYNSLEGQSRNSACIPCTAGSFSSSEGSASCSRCRAGTYQPKARQSTCVPASSGHYADKEGLRQQKKCLAGWFSSASGSSKCTMCPKGSVSASPGAASCIPCPAGRFASHSGLRVCAVCPAGQFSSAGATGCSPCPLGTHASGSGSGGCARCPAGQFASDVGSKSCSKCPPGHFAGRPGSSSCSKCPPGHFASSAGSRGCSRCRAGTFASGHGSSGCSACDFGKFASGTGNTKCKPCPSGRYASSKGRSSCIECPAGTFASARGRRTCSKCGYGKFATGKGSKKCGKCGYGQYAQYKGTKKCSYCTPRYYGPKRGMRVCSYCHGTRSNNLRHCFKRLSLSKCRQSSTYQFGSCQKAYDGNADGRWHKKHCTHTQRGSGRRGQQFWQAQFKRKAWVRNVVLYNRNVYQDRLNNFVIKVDGNVCARYRGRNFRRRSFQCNGGVKGRRIRVINMKRRGHLTICEIQVTGTLL